MLHWRYLLAGSRSALNWPAIGFTLSLVIPSCEVAQKYFGLTGVVVYLIIASAALLSIHRWYFAKLVSIISVKEAVGLAAARVVLLVVMFSVGYPLATSGR